jgi:hypothetical protein
MRLSVFSVIQHRVSSRDLTTKARVPFRSSSCGICGGRTDTELLLGAFAKLRKATISFVMSVCLIVRMEQLGSQWRDFEET